MSDKHDDRQEIEAVLCRYARLLDTKQYARLNEVFVPEATANYVGLTECEGLESIVNLIAGVLDQCGATQHLLGNVQVEVRGDQASARCYLQAIHVGLGDFSDQVFTVWGEYRDRLLKTPAGWRINHRELTTLHAQGDIGLTQEEE